MGGWVCLQSLAQLPEIKKGFALSTWDIYGAFKDVKTEWQMMERAKQGGSYFALNTPLKELFKPASFFLQNSKRHDGPCQQTNYYAR